MKIGAWISSLEIVHLLVLILVAKSGCAIHRQFYPLSLGTGLTDMVVDTSSMGRSMSTMKEVGFFSLNFHHAHLFRIGILVRRPFFSTYPPDKCHFPGYFFLYLIANQRSDF